jgi:hypothetical protein
MSATPLRIDSIKLEAIWLHFQSSNKRMNQVRWSDTSIS